MTNTQLINATDVINKIRRQEFVSPATCLHFFSQDNADSLRSLVKETDLEVILSFIYKTSHDDVFRLGIHLLQGIQMYSSDEIVRARVRGILEGLWDSSRNSVTRGTSVCFALLNIDDIPPELHNSLLQFYLDTWDYQCENQLNWSGGADHVIEKVKQRLNDKRFPRSKKWIYILALGASNNPKAVAETLKNVQDDAYPIIQRACDEVKRRCLSQ